MDRRTYEALKERIEYLELQLNRESTESPSAIPSIVSQLSQLQSNLSKLSSSNEEFSQIYEHLSYLHLWKKINSSWSEIEHASTDIEEDIPDKLTFNNQFQNIPIEVKRQAILSRYSSIITTLSQLNEITSMNLSSLMSFDTEILLHHQSLSSSYTQIMSLLNNLNIVSIKSIALLEGFAKFFIHQNEFWSSCEERLVAVQKKIVASEQKISERY